jgi:hypothetical protein
MSANTRIDEVDRYYDPIGKLNGVSCILFWILVALSFSQLFADHYADTLSGALKIAFLTIALLSFTLSLVLRFSLIPKAERARRKQNLSNALGTSLSEDHTNLYYNNEYRESILKLGANTFENSLFSKEIASEMLKSRRFIILGYFLAWLLVLFVRESDLALITWVTQFVFSGEILVSWISLEILRCRHENVYERYYEFFRHGIDESSEEGVATILDIFADYESAKASAGIKLDSDIFEKLNPPLTKKWECIKEKLKMNPNKAKEDNDLGGT